MQLNNQTYHNTSTGQMILPVATEILINKNDPVFTFNEVVERIDLDKYISKNHLGRDGYNQTSLLKIILFAFMINVRSTRKISELCANDIRLMWLSDSIKPSHNAIARFIKDNLTKSVDDIFVEINNFIIKKEQIDTSIMYIDGTKIEADANKYSFVWKKAVLKFRAKLYLKISKLFTKLNNGLPQYETSFNLEIKDTYQEEELEEIINSLENIIEKYGITLVSGKGNKKLDIQRYYDLLKGYLEKLIDYNEKIEICGSNRNSYSKSDHDATFMRMKEDHMKNGQLKAGYNIQIGVSEEYIMNAKVYQDCTDTKPFESFLDDYKSKYGFIPKYPVTDAGYGGYDNYLYCKANNLELVQKYVMYSKEKESSFKKQRYNKRNFERLEDGTILCPEKHPFEYEYSTINTKGKNDRIMDYYKCEECQECSYQKECTKAKDGYRRIQICEKLNELELEAKKALDSPLGIELRVNRSIQVEGAFGVIKEDMKYRRISRIGIENVETEFKLVCIGYNLMKYHNKKKRKIKELS